MACWVDPDEPEAARAVVREGGRWIAEEEPRRLVVGHVDAWLPALRSRRSLWQLDRGDLVARLRAALEGLAADAPGAEPLLLSSPDPAAAAASWGRREGVDLNVVAAHGGIGGSARMGGFAGPLVALAGAPVVVLSAALIVRESPPDGAPGRASHVACCIDGSPTSEAALSWALEHSTTVGARLTLVHGIVRPRPLRLLGLSRLAPARRREDVVARMATRAAELETAFAVIDGRPRDVCTWASRNGVGLIVAGAGQRRSGARLPGSFASEVAAHGPCPVVLVPQEARL